MKNDWKGKTEDWNRKPKTIKREHKTIVFNNLLEKKIFRWKIHRFSTGIEHISSSLIIGVILEVTR